jgi:hypothetical protein
VSWQHALCIGGELHARLLLCEITDGFQHGGEAYRLRVLPVNGQFYNIYYRRGFEATPHAQIAHLIDDKRVQPRRPT